MSTPESPPAFPPSITCTAAGDVYHGYDGMTLRDWFAGQALAGFLADGSQRKIAASIEADLTWDDSADAETKAAIVNEQIAIGVYALADAMLAARTHNKTGEDA